LSTVQQDKFWSRIEFVKYSHVPLKPGAKASLHRFQSNFKFNETKQSSLGQLTVSSKRFLALVLAEKILNISMFLRHISSESLFELLSWNLNLFKAHFHAHAYFCNYV